MTKAWAVSMAHLVCGCLYSAIRSLISDLIGQDLDLSIRSREEDDLPPLERARRRRSILLGGQTRLVP